MRVDKLPERELRPCGLCWFGPCMCDGVTDTRHKIIPAHPSEPAMTYRGMAYTNPIARQMIDTDTASFRADMQAEVQAGVERRKRAEE